MARPQKSPENRRTEQVKITVTPIEKAQLCDKADRANVSLTEFTRASALNKSVTVQQTTAPDFATRHELRNIGNNLNQIARALNSGRNYAPDELTALCGKLDLLFDDWLNHDPQSRKIRP